MVRPTHAYRASLRVANKEDYRLLLQTCIEALLNKQTEVILATSHLMVWPDDFPKGLIVRRQPPVIYRRIKANRLLHWLNKKGHTEVTMEDLRVEQRKMTLLEKEILDDDFLQM